MDLEGGIVDPAVECTKGRDRRRRVEAPQKVHEAESRTARPTQIRDITARLATIRVEDYVDKDPMERNVDELDALYRTPQSLSAITHVLGCTGNIHHDRLTVEVLTEDSKRLVIPFTQTALRTLMQVLREDLKVERPKAN